VIDVATDVANRTPEPTATPGRVERRIDQFVQDTGLEGRSFLGLPLVDWIDLGISVLIIVIGYWVGIPLLARLLSWFVKRTNLKFDDSFLAHILPDLKMLIILFFMRFAVLRLNFLSDEFRTFLDDVFFILGLLVITVIAVRLINFGTRWYENELLSDEDRSRMRPVITALNRFGLFIVFVLAASIGMSHFGINIGALSLTLIVVVVVISFGARNIIGDVISGFIILADQPIRVHDGVLITEMDTWGDVLEIGTLSTRILTVDNREEIVPNSKILASKVVNYTYPDPHYRMQVDIGIAFGSDLVKARQVITDALKKVDHIVPEKMTEVLFIGFGDTNRKIRVRWWIDDYHQQWVVLNEVCTVIESALAGASIDMPFGTYNLNVKMQDENPSLDEQDAGEGSI
jgi:small-conductance mechanosensitive channel